MKNRLTNYNFWISLVSAVLLILQAFNFQFDIAYINEIATAVLGLLVVIGIISDPTKVSKTNISNQQNETKNEESADLITEQTGAQKSESDNPKYECKNEDEDAEMLEKELEKSVPIAKQNENDANDFEIDYQTLIKQISSDINTKLSKLYSVSDYQSALISETQDEVVIKKEDEKYITEQFDANAQQREKSDCSIEQSNSVQEQLSPENNGEVEQKVSDEMQTDSIQLDSNANDSTININHPIVG